MQIRLKSVQFAQLQFDVNGKILTVCYDNRNGCKIDAQDVGQLANTADRIKLLRNLENVVRQVLSDEKQRFSKYI